MGDEQAVLVFDGDCGFCTAAAAWVARRWRVPARTEPYQDLGPGGLAAMGLRPAQAAARAWWVEPGRPPVGGHLAVAAALAAAPGAWGALGRAAGHAPLRWAGAALYPVVARYRHHLPGSTPACRVPTGSNR